jgi:hypothetical protein
VRDDAEGKVTMTVAMANEVVTKSSQSDRACIL